MRTVLPVLFLAACVSHVHESKFVGDDGVLYQQLVCAPNVAPAICMNRTADLCGLYGGAHIDSSSKDLGVGVQPADKIIPDPALEARGRYKIVFHCNRSDIE